MANTNKTKTTVITQTGVMLALLIILQAVTKPAGTVVTGFVRKCSARNDSAVRGACRRSRCSGGISVFRVSACIGPGISPLTPMIAIGNMVFVTVIWLLL